MSSEAPLDFSGDYPELPTGFCDPLVDGAQADASSAAQDVVDTHAYLAWLEDAQDTFLCPALAFVYDAENTEVEGPLGQLEGVILSLGGALLAADALALAPIFVGGEDAAAVRDHYMTVFDDAGMMATPGSSGYALAEVPQGCADAAAVTDAAAELNANIGSLEEMLAFAEFLVDTCEGDANCTVPAL